MAGLDAIPTYQARYNTVAGGGSRRSNPNPAQLSYRGGAATGPGGQTYTSNAVGAPTAMPAAPGAVTDQTNVGQQVKAFQGYAREGVQGYGDLVGQDFRRNVGSMLGDLNSIGALRSGATVSGLNDLTTNYGRQIGNYASMATQGAIGEGMQAANTAAEQKYRADAEARARKQSTLGTIGKLIGGVGGLLPGPVGQVAGAIGSVFGG